MRSGLLLKLMLFSAVFLIFNTVNAQVAERIVKGKVTDETGQGLPGTTIQIKGTTKTTVSNNDGGFSIQLAGPQSVLVFSFIGYTAQEVAAGNQTTINVQLKPNEEGRLLNDVVVVGYGSQKKSNVTGAISSVKGEELSKMTVGTVGSALQGKVSGVSVVGAGSEPGASPQVFIRGISTFGSNAPLYVVDGVPLTDISFLNPKNIASLDVLKDASSSAIYGSRASNGVIIITTISGTAGKTVVTFDASSGFSDALRKPKMADSREYASIMNLAAANSGNQPVYKDVNSLTNSTDWWNEVTQRGVTQDYNLSLTGGSDKLTFSSSVGYYKEKGLVKSTDFNRVNFRLKTEYKISPKIKIGEDINISGTGRTPSANPGGSNSIFQNAILADPVTPARVERSSNPFDNYGTSPTDIPNSLAVIERNFQNVKNTYLVGSLYANVEIIPGLVFEPRFSVNGDLYEYNSFSPTYNISATQYSLINSARRQHDISKNWNNTNTLTYKKQFGEHSLTVLAGFTQEKFMDTRLYAGGQGIPSNDPSLRYPVSSTGGFNIGVGDGSRFDNVRTLQSYLGRINYSYKDKYLLTASVRADGSSIFAPKNRWGTFPAVSAGWALSKEDFLKDAAWLDNLKIRAGYGQVGNQGAVPLGQYVSNLGTIYSAMGSDGASQVGAIRTSVPNPDLKWETVEDINLGLDAAFLKNRLTVSGDYFVRNVKDMIATQLIVAYAGFGGNSPWTNVGTMQTKGFEFSLGYQDKAGEFSYGINLNATHYTATAKKLAQGNDIIAGNTAIFGRTSLTREGYPVGSFYGLQTNGIFQNAAEVANYKNADGKVIQPNAVPGDFKFKDLNGDGVINSSDRTFIGNPTPKLTFGLNLTAAYKNFDLTVFFTGNLGGDLVNVLKGYTNSGSNNYNKVTGLENIAWRGEGTSNTVPRIAAFDNNGNYSQFSDFYIESGSFARLRNLQLGYTFSPAKVGKIRVFASAQNLLTITNYKGLDPEIAYGTQWTDNATALNRGLDWGNYPTARTFIFGLNFTY
ncbi:SusC/RagA family TonB-linked outer membrane protein [Pedobacter antarcticus]|uniref:SusC/RagA family TonB-linked outer membrane protein n=1 Tax=Pedobacter antarcticus TaxID=34086 RepID=UPI001C57AFB6|nr:TonB-dependent receptor [Pedobacter antarcticus]